MDLDGDQLKEIYVHGLTGAHIHLLHVFKLREEEYRFRGTAGGNLESGLKTLLEINGRKFWE